MEPGTPIRCEMTKWGDRPHWQFDGILPRRRRARRVARASRRAPSTGAPAWSSSPRSTCVTLRAAASGWYAATFHAPGIWCDLYVDIATPAAWDGTVLRAVDLDLDVVRMADPPPGDGRRREEPVRGPGEVFVDDEDEFAEHQVAYGYPAEVIEAAQASCDRLVAAVRAGEAPYDGTHQRWLDLLAELSRLTSS